MDHFGLPNSPQFERSVFYGVAQTAAQNWQTYVVPRGKSMLHIFMLGGGGGGGSGVIGANSTAAGGGGGGSGAQTIVLIPTAFIPQRLYISVALAKTGTGQATYVSALPAINSTQHVIGFAAGGGAGGNAAGATAGAAGAAGLVANSSNMSLGWPFATVLAGQAGIIGGTNVAGGNLSYPATLRVTGGVGGGGLPAAGVAGTAGGGISALAVPAPYYGANGGAAQPTATSPANPGLPGVQLSNEIGLFWQGGTGGGSTHGTATGGGLVQARGGDGAIGCGGGGMGGALTGSAAAVLSMGGGGIVIITAF